MNTFIVLRYDCCCSGSKDLCVQLEGRWQMSFHTAYAAREAATMIAANNGG